MRAERSFPMSQAKEGCCLFHGVTEEAAADYLAKLEATLATMPGRIVYSAVGDEFPNAYYDPTYMLRPESQVGNAHPEEQDGDAPTEK